MKTPLVSIIVPVYNTGTSAKTLAKTLLSSTYENLEIIFVDDGSKDDSLKTLKTLKNSKIKIFSKPNGGASSARNFGIEQAKGDYLLFIDSDDSVDPTFVEKLVRKIERPNTALAATAVHYKKLSQDSSEDVYTNSFPYFPDEKTSTFVLRSLLADGRMYPAFNKIFRADTIRKYNLRFDESWDFAEDTKFVLDYLKHVKGETRFILEPLYIYNFGTATSSVQKTGIIWRNWQKSFKNLKAWVGSHPSVKDRALLVLIHAKWRVACFRSVRRAKEQEKTKNV